MSHRMDGAAQALAVVLLQIALLVLLGTLFFADQLYLISLSAEDPPTAYPLGGDHPAAATAATAATAAMAESGTAASGTGSVDLRSSNGAAELRSLLGGRSWG